MKRKPNKRRHLTEIYGSTFIQLITNYVDTHQTHQRNL